MKKIIVLLLTITIFLTTGCEKEEKERICKKKEDNIEYVVTISKDEKVIIYTETIKNICLSDNLCELSSQSDTKETNKTLKEVVDEYQKEGYSCE